MACGDGKISRGYLSSAPTDPATLFTRAYVGLPAARAVPAAPAVVRLPRAPLSEKWGDKEILDGKEVKQMYYSLARGENVNDTGQVPEADVTDYFIGPNGNPTVDPNRHIHVIHDEGKKEVKLILTDRTQENMPTHLLEITLPGDASGNQVKRAINAMLVTLNAIPRGPKSVTWP
jgi:hypothetical protein